MRHEISGLRTYGSMLGSSDCFGYARNLAVCTLSPGEQTYSRLGRSVIGLLILQVKSKKEKRSLIRLQPVSTRRCLN